MGFLIELGALAVVVAWLIASSARPEQQKPLARGLVSRLTTTQRTALLFGACLLGLLVRLDGFDRSLWLDEFGTLWTVEDGAAETVRRAFSFQGQSPFYYLVVRLFVWLFGESEIALRLPSLLAGIAAVGVLYLLGKEIWDESTGRAAAALGLISFPLASASANARPYMLAGLMMAVFLLGFVRAVRHGRLRDRTLFIAGGIGLFSSHYVVAAGATGVGIAYVSLRGLRERYPPKKFTADVFAQALGAAVWIPQLAALWQRRGGLSWLGEPDWSAWLQDVLPLLPLALTALCVNRRGCQNENRTVEAALWITIVTPPALLGLLALRGTNLIEGRYLFGILIPATLLAARALATLRFSQKVLPSAYWALVTLLYFAAQVSVTGSLSGAGRQDWRSAIAYIEHRNAAGQATPVLFRSGFVEQDRVLSGDVPNVILAPLRSPRQALPPWKVVPLTYRWEHLPGREQYFLRSVLPRVRDSDEFYFLGCRCYNDWTGNYTRLFRNWLEKTLPGRFTCEEREVSHGIVVLHFVRRTDEETARRGPAAMAAGS